MKSSLKSVRQTILDCELAYLCCLRRVTSELPDQSIVGEIVAAIGLYENMLRKIARTDELIEWSARANADILHEIAIAQYGEDSPEAEAVFDEQDRAVTKVIRRLFEQRQARERFRQLNASIKDAYRNSVVLLDPARQP